MGNPTSKYIARFLVEAETPLFVGSGKSSLLKDALVQKDANGFPMIPGTSLAGVLRHSFSNTYPEKDVSQIFGSSKGSDEGTGSLLKVSSATMVLDHKTVSEGLILGNKWQLEQRKFDQLPIRQHVRINDKGIAEKNGLFDNEVIYKGTRFVFELELTSYETNYESSWGNLIALVKGPEFKIGSGTRNGYGSLKVLKLFERKFDLNIHLDEYLDFSPSFSSFDWNALPNLSKSEQNNAKSNVHYILQLTPDPFFIFGSGHGDDEVDNTPLEEEVVVYSEGGIEFRQYTVIPASSIKGTISHRVAFHFNKNLGRWAKEDTDAKTGSGNEAVSALFGKAGVGITDPMAGKVFFKDLYLQPEEIVNDKIFNHVAIDRFTGGALDGALFSEKVSRLTSNLIIVEIQMDHSVDSPYREAFESALGDICKGLLPLGGMTTKGHGVFTGFLFKDGEEIFNYLNS